MARKHFADFGYDKTSVRAIARDAHVDCSLVRHYFGSKRSLFVAVTEASGSAAPVGSSSGESIVRAFLERSDSPSGRSLLETLLRSAATDQMAAQQLTTILTSSILHPIARRLSDKPSMTKLRAALVCAQLVGLAWQRYILHLEPAATASPALVARVYGPSIDATLQGLDFHSPGS